MKSHRLDLYSLSDTPDGEQGGHQQQTCTQEEHHRVRVERGLLSFHQVGRGDYSKYGARVHSQVQKS